ncbi:hypothetical protein B0H15DRAFT_176044 [Mycena belliarum]|uniref:F-box domain-containing protein n=1 Tax=Mycena belliarum TaxID=1033014 RepID=A0AAD6XP36_9AGAR|nr:hypothetical protein B0H15DRAFT_176044 [Mycena belliae]
MSPLLQHLPYDVLQHIALLCAPPGLAPPTDLCSLLATCRALCDALNRTSSPHVYAAIFRLKYARNALPDSALARELVQRCCALRRCRDLDMSVPRLRQDLWTLLWLVIEEGPCAPLSEARFTKFLVELAQHHLSTEVRVPPQNDLQSLVIWLLCFGFTREDILSQSPELRNTLLALLRPFVSVSTPRSRFTSPLPSSHIALTATSPLPARLGPQFHDDDDITHYNTRVRVESLPPPTSAAIILTFALKEAVPMQIPYHIPATRAIAAAENRPGPTAEDYAVFQRAGTLLFSDVHATHPAATLPSGAPSYHCISDVLQLQLPARSPGTLTGVWEGALMISSCAPLGDAAAPQSPDFLCRTPMQCEFTEYFCRGPCRLPPLALPSASNVGTSPCERFPKDPELVENPASQMFKLGDDLRDYDLDDPTLDHILVGQTLPAHEEAWGSGGFNFAGRVQDDGLIVFTRQPDDDENPTPETWVFEGHLRYGTALVGTFRSSSSGNLCGIQGIFSMRKRAEAPPQ